MEKSITKLTICPFCLKEHEVFVMEEPETTEYKGKEIVFTSKYLYCEEVNDCFEDEDVIDENHDRVKEAYRVKTGELK